MLPRDVHPESLSRLPLLGRAELDEQGRKQYDAVVSPENRTLVGLRGPSGIWLHSPRLGGFLRAANQYLRFETALDRRLTELAILVTARELDNQFEWTAHEPAALTEGLDPKIIDTFLAMPHVSSETKRKILWDNCARLYNLQPVSVESPGGN